MVLLIKLQYLLLLCHNAGAAAFSVNRHYARRTSSRLGSVITSTTTSPTLIGEKCEQGGTILDETAMIKQQQFPIPPEELIAKAKYALTKDSGVLDPTLWSDDFEFCAPVVGPLSKTEFLSAANDFGIYDAFPDFDNRYANFCVDPLEPGRVWFFVRLAATNTGTGLFGKSPPDPKEDQPTVFLPPQVFSFLFEGETGLIREMTVGYSMDRRQGNTGGVGGMFGLLYGVGQGLPIPEGQPYKKSKRFQLFTQLGKVASRFTKKE